MTGTPAGVAALSPGDNIECGVDGIGTLKVAICKAACAAALEPSSYGKGCFAHHLKADATMRPRTTAVREYLSA